MFEDQGGQNKNPAEAEEDRNVYFGAITESLEERATSHLPPSSRRSPPRIQLHLHTSRLFIISPSLQGFFFLSSVCFITSFPSILHRRSSLTLLHFSLSLL